MRSNTLALLIVIAGIVCLALGIFYFLPGPYHPFTFSGTPTGRHTTHAVAFFALGIVALIGSRFVRQSSGRP
jgi:hypothetical protein